MATYLSNYLSGPKTVKTRGSTSFPVIKRYNPYSTSQYRAVSATPISAPYSGQDLAAALLQQQQNRQATTPSSDFQDNYNYDPIQTKIQSLGAQSVANAQTNAAQLRKEAAINEGDPELLRSLGLDENTINAASNNPQSLLAQLNTEYQNRQRQLADSMQAQNLYFSGEYQKNLLDLAHGKSTAEANLGQKLRDLLAGVDSGVLDSQESARKAALQEQLDAQANAQTNSLYASLLASLRGTGNDPAATSTDFSVFGPNTPGQPQTGTGMIGAGFTPIASFNSIPTPPPITVPNLRRRLF